MEKTKKKINKLMTMVFATLLFLSGAATSLIGISTIHADDTGSITIHKHEAGGIGEAGDGQELDAAEVAQMGNPIADVPYFVYEISSNLTAEQLSDLNGALEDPAIVKALHDLTKTNETLTVDDLKINLAKVSPANIADSMTDENGNLTIDELALDKYYIVIEQAARHVSLPQSAPFVVRVPTNITNDGQTQEIKDIHVYPKGLVLSFAPQKRVGEMQMVSEAGGGLYELFGATEGGIGVGGSNFYTMSLQISPGYVDANIPNAKIEISDIFPEALQLKNPATDLDKLVAVYGNPHMFGDMSQKIDADEIAKYFEFSYVKNGDGRNELKVTIQNISGDPGDQAELNEFLDTYNRLYFSFEVENTSTDGYQTFPNDIEVNYWRDASIPDDVTINEKTVEEATMHTGGFKYTKMTDDSDQLPGATFRVGVKVNGDIQYVKVIKNDEGTITKVLLPGDDGYDDATEYYEAVSSADEDKRGVVEFNSLPVYEKYKYVAPSGSDVDTTPDEDDPDGDIESAQNENLTPTKMKYFVVEMSAPAGYEKLTEPRAVQPDELSSTEKTDEYSTIVNVKKFTLPFTGIAGWWLFLLGFVVVGMAGFLLIRNQRKAKARV
ncbi:hypothetical protein EQG49_13070 [Periweissella cryptocerci]|uniref:Gram-positive pilin subunit D1 N-terminal domain-containing protein n=1 Tax=Periweissella cryptocerci TaxID=2506420 RepID=A0A4P6YX05_9LACO|nr:SpaH/EbpB family LPXTG-anchored major pilin [Periweissella cryptocerci]QBO37327.1 hypothetical protein EQG49_13070 [Periweissella cryptocerci]